MTSAGAEAAASPPCTSGNLDVYVPNSTVSKYVAHPATGCRNAAVHLISHQPYRRP